MIVSPLSRIQPALRFVNVVGPDDIDAGEIHSRTSKSYARKNSRARSRLLRPNETLLTANLNSNWVYFIPGRACNHPRRKSRRPKDAKSPDAREEHTMRPCDILGRQNVSRCAAAGRPARQPNIGESHDQRTCERRRAALDALRRGHRRRRRHRRRPARHAGLARRRRMPGSQPDRARRASSPTSTTTRTRTPCSTPRCRAPCALQDDRGMPHRRGRVQR